MLPLVDILLIAAGVLGLYLGGEALVRGATTLARSVGMSPLVVGLTVVSFGTSAPELASTLAANLQGAPAVAFGNVVGSNIANVGLILGLTALLWPLATSADFLRREVPFMLFASGLLFWLVVDGVVSRGEGVALVVLLVIFLVSLLRRGGEPAMVKESFEDQFGESHTPIWKSLLAVAVGCVFLVVGAKALLTGAINVARVLGFSERVIGLTMVALGTSLPEMASSLVAAFRRQGDIVLGNVVGSNIFNVLCILGITAVVKPVPVVPSTVWVDLLVMLALSAFVWPFLLTSLKTERWEGAVLLAGYAGYMAWLFR